MTIVSKIKELREKSKKRNFTQSFDIAINLKNIDLRKPENKIKGEIVLPLKIKENKIGIFADSLIHLTKGIDNIILIKKDEIDKLGKNKKSAKNLIKDSHLFLAEAPLMPLIGKTLGQILGPRNKLPKPIPPNTPNIKPLIETARRTINFSLKDSATIHCIVGKEDMKDEDVEKNIEAVLNTVKSSLPKGKEQIKDINLKLTMSKPVKLEVV